MKATAASGNPIQRAAKWTNRGPQGVKPKTEVSADIQADLREYRA
jgi:hypothetical protein